MSQSVESVVASGASTKPQSTVGQYTLDGSHSHVGFSVRHMMISNVRGEFRTVSGEVAYDPGKPEATKLSVVIDVASIHTSEDKRDEHLKSPDFFDVAKFPTITFTSTKAKRTGDGVEVAGELTIHGVTRPVTLAVEDITPERSDPWGNRRIGATARTKILRSDFGMMWNAAIEAGGILVGDEIKIEIEAELVKKA